MSAASQEKNALYLPAWLVLPLWIIGVGLTLWAMLPSLQRGEGLPLTQIFLLPLWFLNCQGFHHSPAQYRGSHDIFRPLYGHATPRRFFMD